MRKLISWNLREQANKIATLMALRITQQEFRLSVKFPLQAKLALGFCCGKLDIFSKTTESQTKRTFTEHRVLNLFRVHVLES